MKIAKSKIQKIILNYLFKESVKKKIKVNFNLEKIDFIEKEIIDSLGFLTLISHLEKKLNAEIDLSDKNPDNLTKAEKLVKTTTKKNGKYGKPNYTWRKHD